MITKITGQTPFQVLTNNFSISPSNEGYTLQISADGVNFSNLFSVGANVTRLVTGVAANSYYRLLGNESAVQINWMKTCVTEGGSGGSDATYSAGTYIDITQDVISVTGITPDLYLTSADTENFITSADTENFLTSADTADFVTSAYVETKVASAFTYINEVEQVTASGYTELHDGLMEVSARTVDLSGYYTSAQTDSAIATALTAYTPTTGFATVNGSAITNGGNLVIEGGSGPAPDMSSYMTSGDAQVIATALVDLNDRVAGLEYENDAVVVKGQDKTLGGMPIRFIAKIYQSDYDQLINDGLTEQDTFYVVLPDPEEGE